MTSSYPQTSYPRLPFISLTNQNEAFLKTHHPLTNERARFASFTYYANLLHTASQKKHWKVTSYRPTTKDPHGIWICFWMMYLNILDRFHRWKLTDLHIAVTRSDIVMAASKWTPKFSVDDGWISASPWSLCPPIWSSDKVMMKW